MREFRFLNLTWKFCSAVLELCFLEHKSCEDLLRELGLLSLEKRRTLFKRDPIKKENPNRVPSGGTLLLPSTP